MPISMDCPKCGEPHHLANELGGKKIRCIACREIVSVPVAGLKPQATATTQKTVRLSAECSSCRCTMLVSQEHAGKTIRCVRCQNPVVVQNDIPYQDSSHNKKGGGRPSPRTPDTNPSTTAKRASGKGKPQRPQHNRDVEKPNRRRRPASLDEQPQTTDDLEDLFQEEIEQDECLANLSAEERIAYGLATPVQTAQPTMTDRRNSVMAFGYRDDMGMHQSSSGNWNVMLFTVLAIVLCLGTFVVVQKHLNEPQSGQSSLMLDLAIVVGLSPAIAASLTFQMIAYSEDLVTGFLIRRIPFLALICLFDNRYNHPMVWRMFVVGLFTMALTLPVLFLSSG
jgi:hypothetical protein